MNPDVVETSIPLNVRGEMKLWAAVMVKGVDDYHSGDRSANYWFWSDDYHVGSFNWLCDLFNADPDYIRNRVKNA